MEPVMERSIADLFQILYYTEYSRTWANTSWFGVPIQKNPLDLWIYQEILFERKPDLIIETGTADGGSALYLASLCDLIDNGKIITIDIENKPERPKHRRVTYLTDSSISEEVVRQVKKRISKKAKVMVILDSDHGEGHVSNELKIYSELVTPGEYLIVEDTNLNGHPVYPQHGPGPREAVDKFLAKDKRYVVDAEREKFFMTFNPKGFLKRVEDV